MKRIAQTIMLLLAALLGPAGETAWAQAEGSSDEDLREAIRLIQSGTSLDKALSAAQQAARALPKSHLASFLQYQAYISMAGGDPIQAPPAVKSSPDAHRELVNESKARGKLVTVPKGALPSAVIQIGPGTDTVLLVESERSRLWILHRKGDSVTVVANHYVTVGQQGVGKEREGDRKTPLGVYRIQSEIPGAKLIDFYGPLALPLDYPNPMDRARAKTGSGIWVHGVPSDRYARPPMASDGCVVLANEDLLALRKYAKPGRTTVVVVPQTNWLSPTAWRTMASNQLAELPIEMFQKVTANGGNGAKDNSARSVYHLEAERTIVAEYIDRRGQSVRDYWKREGGRWVPYLDATAAAVH
jgi:lipoprotein-anchoring transpeptidase ErfK/SrfK